jgi:deoxyribose-phosphate aldolase
MDTATRSQQAGRVLSLLDLTSLGENDTPADIEALCGSARSSIGAPAAVCVYSEHVTTACRSLEGTAVRVATVVNFPDGASDPERVERETRRALGAGADEIDLVLPYRALLQGQEDRARLVVKACLEACSVGTVMKLILETGELVSPELIRQACAIGIDAGVDFLKTSTGKVPVNATPEAVTLMLEAIAAADGRCGIKIAGGVRTLDDAQTYLDLVESRMGADWINPAHVRIGASSLYTDLAAALPVSR